MKTFDPLEDGKSLIALIGHMGSDLDVVNDAKASYNKMVFEMTEKEEKLINYLMLAEPPHMSPFRGVVFKFQVKAPLFIARQWYKHTVASCHVDEQLQWNEMSLRYVKLDEPEFYIPKTFYNQSVVNKQKSGDPLADLEQEWSSFRWNVATLNSAEDYQYLLQQGVSREIARGVLIPAVYTQWHWTASLQALLNFIELREGAGAQSEIGKYATAIETILREYVPVTMKAWDKKRARDKARKQAYEFYEKWYSNIMERSSKGEITEIEKELMDDFLKILYTKSTNQ